MQIFSNKFYCLENRKVNRKSSEKGNRKFSEKEMFMDVYKENNKVHEFLFGERKASIKNKRFMNFYSCFSAAQIINSALLHRE